MTLDIFRELIIDGYHTWGDWGCWLQQAWYLEPASVKYLSVPLQGGDGDLDFSDALTGFPNYSTRILKATLVFPPDSRQNWDIKNRIIQNAINGRRVKIVLPDDIDHYLIGRYVSETGSAYYDDSTEVATIELYFICDSWKLKKFATNLSYTDLISQVIKISNESRPAVPTITTTQPLTITYGNNQTLQLPAGARDCPELVLGAGWTTWTVAAAAPADVTIAYQEGSL